MCEKYRTLSTGLRKREAFHGRLASAEQRQAACSPDGDALRTGAESNPMAADISEKPETQNRQGAGHNDAKITQAVIACD